MANTKKTWIAVLIAVFIVAGLGAIGLVAGSAYWISRHVSSQSTSTESAEAELDRVRARFAGQPPLVEFSGDSDRPTVRRPPRPAESTRRGDLQALHARVFDPDNGKIVRADIPFWLIRLGKSFSFMPNMGSVTLEDLERHGPGLIVNGHSDEGHQVLVWID
jgi:hypothetical protein